MLTRAKLFDDITQITITHTGRAVNGNKICVF